MAVKKSNSQYTNNCLCRIQKPENLINGVILPKNSSMSAKLNSSMEGPASSLVNIPATEEGEQSKITSR